jgi:exopolysaccharide biosynthesis polyprenyl glycosylphosphotransferase
MAYAPQIVAPDSRTETLLQPVAVAEALTLPHAAAQHGDYRHLHDRAMVVLRPIVLMLDLAVLCTTGWLVSGGNLLQEPALTTFLLVTALFVPLFYAFGLARRTTLQRLRPACVRPAVALALSFAGVALIDALTGIPALGSALPGWAAVSILTTLAVRLGLAHLLNRHPLAARWQESIAFLGQDRDIAHLFATLPACDQLPVKVAGYYSMGKGQPEATLQELPRLGNVEGKPYLLLDRVIDRLVIVAREMDAAQINALLGKVSALACPIDLCLLPLVAVTQAKPAEPTLTSLQALLQHCRLIPLQAAPISVAGRAAKRLFDLVASSLAILALSPVLAVAALAVRFNSPGPALFRQPRWGRGGQTFKIFKFRSMYMDTCDSGRGSVQQATRNDPRITPVGRFLRSSSLDELPQLFNVLKGDMSLIGPRPHAVAHNELYAEQVSDYIARHQAKPGLSGWAQVHGYRGETPHVQLMQKRIDYDVAYIRNWSLFLDFRIILRTVGLLVSRKNAW